MIQGQFPKSVPSPAAHLPKLLPPPDIPWHVASVQATITAGQVDCVQLHRFLQLSGLPDPPERLTATVTRPAEQTAPFCIVERVVLLVQAGFCMKGESMSAVISEYVSVNV